MLAEDTVAEIHLLRVNAEQEFKILFARAKEGVDKNDFAISKLRVNKRQTIRCNIECVLQNINKYPFSRLLYNKSTRPFFKA